MIDALLLYACQPVTYSVDTSRLAHPGRATVAIRRALGEWSALTGLRFAWQPSGGQVSIVYRTVKDEWLAYTMADTIVIDPRIDDWPNLHQRLVAHEMAHVLGVDHQQVSNSIVSADGFMGSEHVTDEDARLVQIQPCD